MHQHTRRLFIILFLTGMIAAPAWFGPIESASSNQKSKSVQSKTQTKSPAPVGSKSLPENQLPGRTSRRQSSVGGTVSSGAAGKPSTQAVDTSNVPTPAIPVGQSGEMIGVPWTGAAGIIETTEQMMIRERQAQLLPKKPRPLRKELEQERPKNLPQNPDAPAVSQWPPVDETNLSQRPGQPGFAVQPLAPQTTSTSFTGATLADTGAFPPDTMGAVGPTQYCVALNGRLRTFNKTTGVADSNLDINSDVFFASVLTTPSTGGFIFTTDPQIRFDRLSDRWFIVMLDVPLNSAGNTDKPNRVLLAVSNTATITSSTAWTLYQFQGDATLFTDYESLGIDANALYIGGDMFTLAGAFNSTKAFVVRKAEMLTASPLVVTAFPNLATNSLAGPFAPRGADNYDPANTGPTATGYFVGVDTLTFSTLMFRRVTDPAGTPTISANISVTVPTTSSSAGVPQSGGTTLDSLDDRLYAAHIRNGRLWTAHNLRVNTSGVASTGTGNRHAVRWYEFQNLGTTPTLVQSGTQFDNTVTNPRHHFIPSIMVSGQGHAAMGCSVSGSTQFAGAFTNGRLTSDTLGTLQTGVVYQAGAANYNPADGSNPHRWGDYSYTSLDPCDDMTMWTIQEFANATNSYGVRVVKLLAPVPTVTACGTATDVPQGTTNMNIVVTGTGFYNPPTTGISACRVPISASVSGTGVTVNSTTFTSATSVTINITVAGGATTGLRDIVITNPDGQSSTGSNGCINITAAPTTTVTSINGVVSNPRCSGSTVTLWQATFASPVSGVTASNFQLQNPGGGLSGFSITAVASVSPAPNAVWNLNVNVGTGSGALQLSMVNSTGVTPMVTNVPFTAGDTYTVVAPPTMATVGGPQTICANGTTTGLGGNTPTVGTGTWSIDSGGTGTFNPNATTPNATFTHTGGTGPVIVRWTISNSPCTASSATVTITINQPPTTATVGGPQTICASGTTVGLGGNTPVVGSGSWSVVGGGTGTFNPNAATPNATFTHTGGTGPVTVRWTISNAPCTDSSATLAITINQAPTTATVGGSQTICASGTTVGLGGNTPVVGSGSWSVVGGGTGTFNPNATTPNATFTHTGGTGPVMVRWTISNAPCTPSTADVTITITQPPTTATVGGPQSICTNGTTTGLGGNIPASGTGTWSVVSGGTGTFNPNATTPNATFIHTGGTGPVTVRWTISNSPCTPDSTADVTITITQGPTTATVGGPQTVCANGTTVGLGGNTPVVGSGSWSVVGGGTGTFNPNAATPNATFTHTGGTGPMMVQWTISSGSCTPSSATVTITITQPPTTATVGGPQSICTNGTTTGLGGNTPSSGAGAWSIVGGGTGTFSPNAATPNATFTHTGGTGPVTVRWTISNSPCTPNSTADVVITVSPAATVNAGPNQTICAGLNVILAGSRGGSSSSATWSGGGGTFAPNASTLNATYTPSPAELIAGVVTLTLTTDDPAGGCPAVSDTMTINLINCSLQYALMVADTSNNRIQGFDGTNWAVIGVGTVGSGNGQFRLPEAVAFSSDGQRIYVADTGNNRIQWSTDAGVTWADFATNGTATNQVKAPQGLTLDSAGNLYASDTGNGRVMRFNGGVPGFGIVIASNGAASGQVGSPRGLAVDSTFRLFVTDETNSRILRINNANTVVAATSGTVIATAGTGMNKVQNPQGITIDSNGTIFVADTGNSRILRWVNANPANASTMALTGSQLGQVNRPEGVTVVQFTSGPFSGGPFLVVGDTSNNRIQGRFIPTGQWSLVGSPNNIGSGVGQFRAPSKIQ